MTAAEWCVFGTLMLYLLTIVPIKWIGFGRFDNARPRDPAFYDEPLRAHAADIPAEHALLGFDGVDVYGVDLEHEDHLLTTAMGFTRTGRGEYLLEGGRRRASYAYDEPPAAAGLQGAGTVHHIAWCDRDDEHAHWREHLEQVGARPTQIVDRQYFLSVYFREPGSLSTKTPSTWARSCGCRHSTSTFDRSSSGR